MIERIQLLGKTTFDFLIRLQGAIFEDENGAHFFDGLPQIPRTGVYPAGILADVGPHASGDGFVSYVLRDTRGQKDGLLEFRASEKMNYEKAVQWMIQKIEECKATGLGKWGPLPHSN